MVVSPTTPVSYELPLGSHRIPLNSYLGKSLKLCFIQEIHCQNCGIAIKKSYQDGYCFPCTQKLAQCDFCILKPERCHFHLGTCREPQWGMTHCMIPHIVYLANSSGLKVGITRQSNIPTRWIDQGAIEALPLFEVPTRRISGLVEVIMAKSVSDKTDWRKMLKGINEPLDLLVIAKNLEKKLHSEFTEIYSEFGSQAIKRIAEKKIYRFEYPVLSYPQKIVSLSLDKTPLIEGTLLGIKGQYLIFDHGVINIRKHSGYVLEFEV